MDEWILIKTLDARILFIVFLLAAIIIDIVLFSSYKQKRKTKYIVIASILLMSNMASIWLGFWGGITLPNVKTKNLAEVCEAFTQTQSAVDKEFDTGEICGRIECSKYTQNDIDIYKKSLESEHDNISGTSNGVDYYFSTVGFSHQSEYWGAPDGGNGDIYLIYGSTVIVIYYGYTWDSCEPFFPVISKEFFYRPQIDVMDVYRSTMDDSLQIPETNTTELVCGE